MTKNEIIEKLEEMGVEFDPKANKADLEKLLEPANDEAEEAPEPEVTPEPEPTPEPEVEQPKVVEPKKPSGKENIDYKTKLQRTKEALAKQPKVRIIVPKEKSETEGAFITVQINGYTFQIKKGVYVEVPQQVADIIMESRDEIEEAHRVAAQQMSDAERPEFDNSQG